MDVLPRLDPPCRVAAALDCAQCWIVCNQDTRSKRHEFPSHLRPTAPLTTPGVSIMRGPPVLHTADPSDAALPLVSPKPASMEAELEAAQGCLRVLPGAEHLTVTGTGVSGRQRLLLANIVQGVGARYSGSLILGVTTHLVASNAAANDKSEKVVKAREFGTPVVSLRSQ